MLRILVWLFLIGVFLSAGYGLNMIRIAVFDELTNPDSVVWWRILIGLVLMVGGISFLAGLVRHREMKKGRVHKPMWRRKEIRRH